MKKVFSLIAVFVFLSSCQKDAAIENKAYPMVRTNEVTDIDSFGATFSAQVVNPGIHEIIDFGFILNSGELEGYYSLFHSSDLDHFLFRCNVDISAGQNYTVRAYVTTTENMVKGPPVDFIGQGSSEPVIIDFEPKSGADGTEVSVYGKNFSIHLNNNKVFLNGQICEILSFHQDTIVIKTPEMKYFGDAGFSISTGAGEVFSKQKYRIIGPAVLNVSTTRSYSGDYLLIEGENFLVNGEHLEVYFDKFKAEIIQAGSSQIQVVVPSTYASYSLIPELLMFITVTNGLKEAKFDRGFLLKSSWEEKTPYISNYNHISRSGFSYGLNGYLVDLNGNRLLEYSSELDQWSDFSDYHGKYTSKSLFVESKGKILQFGGGDMENFWEFDVNNKVWHQKNDLPFYFDHATNFRVENVEYIITNHGQFWSYNLDNELLNRLNNFPETFGNFAFAFVNNGVPYAITYGTTWQYDIVNDVWEVKSLNSIHRSSYSVDALGFMLEDQCYILQNGQDLYKYDLVNDRWVLSSRYPGCRGDNSIKTTFLVDDKIYIAAVASNYGGCAPLLFSFQR